jgi:hypothetical protein
MRKMGQGGGAACAAFEMFTLGSARGWCCNPFYTSSKLRGRSSRPERHMKRRACVEFRHLAGAGRRGRETSYFGLPVGPESIQTDPMTPLMR